MTRVVVVGAGIVGLAVAARLSARGDEVIVLEKEQDVALHQTGRNSGVIHSGVYYRPGSFKAIMCRAGSRSMRQFAAEHGIPVATPGKLIVASTERQRAQLQVLADRAVANGVPARLLDAAEAREYEPAVACVQALRVETTSIVDYRAVCRVLAGQLTAAGGTIRFGTPFASAKTIPGGVLVNVGSDTVQADVLVNCAGLHGDRVARASGLVPGVRIVPFRGEYFELTEERAALVEGLIYPVPDPQFPFLGVHLTRMVGGGVHAGPNAVFAFSREGYRWRDIRPRDLLDSASWPGFWRLGMKNLPAGVNETVRSLSKAVFARSLAVLVPGITARDLRPAPAGVRAQALHRDGTLVDDFFIQATERQVHVLNAPSPAATSALEIATHIVREVDATLAA